MGYLAARLLPYLRPHRLRFAWALVQVFLIVAVALLKPWPLQLVIDHVLAGKPAAQPWLSGLSSGALLGFACLALVVI